jgi:hypothetical protein
VVVFDVQFLKLLSSALLGFGGLFVVGDDVDLGFVVKGVCQQDKEVKAVGDAVIQIDPDLKHEPLFFYFKLEFFFYAHYKSSPSCKQSIKKNVITAIYSKQ